MVGCAESCVTIATEDHCPKARLWRQREKRGGWGTLPRSGVHQPRLRRPTTAKHYSSSIALCPHLEGGVAGQDLCLAAQRGGAHHSALGQLSHALVPASKAGTCQILGYGQPGGQTLHATRRSSKLAVRQRSHALVFASRWAQKARRRCGWGASRTPRSHAAAGSKGAHARGTARHASPLAMHHCMPCTTSPTYLAEMKTSRTSSRGRLQGSTVPAGRYVGTSCSWRGAQ